MQRLSRPWQTSAANQKALREIEGQLERLRQFILQGDTSARVRGWLADTEREEQRLKQALEQLEASKQPALRVGEGQAAKYLEDLNGSLARGGTRAREILRADIERIVVRRVVGESQEPFARAEVITTGKGLLDRVVLVVAGAKFEPATFGL